MYLPLEGFWKWKCVRGTSALEGYHPSLHRVLPIGRSSAVVADSLVTAFHGNWNIKQAIRRGAMPDYGTFNLVYVGVALCAWSSCFVDMAAYCVFCCLHETLPRVAFQVATRREDTGCQAGRCGPSQRHQHRRAPAPATRPCRC